MLDIKAAPHCRVGGALNLAVGFNQVISTQIMFNQIPPAGADGSFNPSLQRLERFPAIPPPAGGGWFNPNPCFPLLSAQAGVEPSTTCRWWDSRVIFLCPVGRA